jgi:hypothetical protein
MEASQMCPEILFTSQQLLTYQQCKILSLCLANLPLAKICTQVVSSFQKGEGEDDNDNKNSTKNNDDNMKCIYNSKK